MTLELPQRDKVCGSQWPRVLTRMFATARLLRLWVRSMDICLLWMLCFVR